MRVTRWLICLPVALLAVFASTQEAQATDGVTAVGYYIGENIPPQRDDSVYTQCGTTIYPNVNWTWDPEQNHLGDCGYDQFAVHFTGDITIPDGVQSVRYWLAHDDGAWANIGGNEFGSWGDQGCTWSLSEPIAVQTQTMSLDLWVYENGGSTCAMLAWELDDIGLAIVPAEAFTTSPSNTTTTTEATTTTWATTTTSTTTTTTSTTTAPTTTVLATTTTTATLPASTTTTMQTTTTQESTTTSQAPQTLFLPAVPGTTTTEQPTTTLATPDTTEPEQTVPETIATITLPPDEPITVVDEPVTTVVPVLPPEPVTDEPVVDEPVVIDEAVIDEAANNIVALVALVANLDEATPEEVEAVVDAVLAQEVSQEQATVLAGSAEVLAVITQEQASQIFEALDLNELNENQLDEVIAAVQDAPTEVREAFETEINIFDGAADTYVPIGSAVPISSRRVVIAATGIVVAAAGSAVQSHSARKNG